MKFDIENFCDEVADILEIDSIGINDKFREASDWNSLKGFSIIIHIANTYNVNITPAQFSEFTTLADVARFVCA